MPYPKAGESKEEYISRCIPYVQKEGTAKDSKQAAAICYSLWDKNNEGEEMDLIDKYLGEEKTRCSVCGRPLSSKFHKENCEGDGKKKQMRKKKQYKLQQMGGYQASKSMGGPGHGMPSSGR